MKNIIPIVIKPYPDELLFSWVYRLANINEMTIAAFSNEYFGTSLRHAAMPPVEIRKGFCKFCEALQYQKDFSELYLSLSTLSFEAIAFPVDQQIRIINNIFMQPNLLNTVGTYFFTDLNVCLDCIKEDIEQYGEAYIHRSHQLAGVKTCHKHHTKLYHFDCKKSFKYDFNSENLSPVVMTNSLEEENRCADYAYDLLQSGLTSNMEEIKKFVLNYLKQKETDEQNAMEALKTILGSELLANRWKSLNFGLDMRQVVVVLMNLFPNVDELIKVMAPHKTLIQRFYCEKCKSYYYSTELAQTNGWGCSNCSTQKTVDELFQEIVGISGNNKYRILEPLSSINEPIKIFHETCEEEIEIKPNNFLFSGVRCYCEKYTSQKAAKEAVEKHKGFKLINFKGTQAHATIYHEECECEFQCNYNSFLNVPRCRCCDMTKMTEEMYVEEVQDLVGDDYTLRSPYRGRKEVVVMRHNACGHEQEYYPYLFSSGYRCSHCHEKVSEKKIKTMLEEWSNGIYQIVGKKNQTYQILNQQTNEIIALTAAQISQEILRPTPSPILPIENCSNKDYLSPWGTWYKLCVEYKEEFGHLDIKKNDVYKGQNIGLWYIRQRNAYSKGKLSPDKIEKLKSIGFIFNQNDHIWNLRLETYKRYVAEYGKKIPTRTTSYEDFNLGEWVGVQRHKNSIGKLSEERKRQLLEINDLFFN